MRLVNPGKSTTNPNYPIPVMSSLAKNVASANCPHERNPNVDRRGISGRCGYYFGIKDFAEVSHQ